MAIKRVKNIISLTHVCLRNAKLLAWLEEGRLQAFALNQIVVRVFGFVKAHGF